MLKQFAPVAAIVMMAAAAGCAKQDPAVGTWSTTTPGGKTASMTLAKDGTGTLSFPGMAMLDNKPITWTNEDKKVTLTLEGAAMPGSTASGMNLPATLSDDAKTLTIALPMISLTFTKQP